ncbi:Ribosomal large subunit pseudouridine synthase D [subsurface metagenome]
MFHISEKDTHKRLDIFLTEKLVVFSRSLIQKYIQDEKTPCVLVNTARKKSNYRLWKGDTVTVQIPEPKDSSLEPADISLNILYEDSDTIVNALIHYLGKTGSLSTIGGEKRPGIVHRLDKDTSGILLIAKNNRAHSNIAQQFSMRKTEKAYEAIVKGIVIPEQGIIDKPISRSTRNRKKFTAVETGRESITSYKVIDAKNETSWVQFIPKTGRTHQIRVHAASIGHPVIGDILYARKSHQAEYIALFAKEIKFTHPRTGLPMTFSAPYPKHFIELAKMLGYSLNSDKFL